MQPMRENAALVERDLMIIFANFAGLQGCLGGGVQAGPQECPRAVRVPGVRRRGEELQEA